MTPMPPLLPPALAATAESAPPTFEWAGTPTGWLLLGLFVLAYAFVVLEERIHLPKSKPVMLAAGLIWAIIAMTAANDSGIPRGAVEHAFLHVFTEFALLFFFLIVAMSYVAAMAERNVFEAMRAELTRRGFSLRQLFWITGVIAFFMSAILDNLTTALVMSAVIVAVGRGNARFVALAFINLVVAANAGGAWSAFGDITTLMVWVADKATFFEFFDLFVPSLVNWVVPAAIMTFAVPREVPQRGEDDAAVRPGGWTVCLLFAATIAVTVGGKYFLHMPAAFGMMFGLALLQINGYTLKLGDAHHFDRHGNPRPYNVFRVIRSAEWDTLLFFYGVLLSVGGLATAGYMALASSALYDGWGATAANVVLGTASAIVDNIPIMYAVLRMDPAMDHGQWLLITLTCGVGGSLLSVGSAAGVALMGQARGMYTFFSHLRWTWAIALGYVLSIVVHLWWNADHFTQGIWR